MVGLRRPEELEAWRVEMRTLEPVARLASILVRYPKGTTIDGIQGMMGMGRTQKIRRQLDGMLRELEKSKFAKMYRAGMASEVRLWGRPGWPVQDTVST